MNLPTPLNLSSMNSLNASQGSENRKVSGCIPARAKGVALLACAFALAHGSASAVVVLPIVDFQGDFDPSNWTATTTNSGNGTVNTAGAPLSVKLTSSNFSTPGGGFQSDVDYTIAAPYYGTFTFDWAYVTPEADTSFGPGAAQDPFLFLVNGVATPVSSTAVMQQMQSGTATFIVEEGDIFGFRQSSTDSRYGAATTTISSIVLTPIPEPSSLFALGFLICGGAFLRSRRCGSEAR